MKILTDIGSVIAQILSTKGGSLELTEFNDRDGVAPVYDMGDLALAAMFSQDTRGFDVTLNQSTASTQTITGLPPVFTIENILISTDDPTRINDVVVYGANVGVAGSVRDDLYWQWLTTTGSAIVNRIQIGDGSLASRLVTPQTSEIWRKGMVVGYQPTVKSRQATQNISIYVNTTAFGAGTVRVTGHVVINFFRAGRFLVPGRPL